MKSEVIKRRQRGTTLMESLAFIAISAIVVVAVIKFNQTTSENQEVVQHLRSMKVIESNLFRYTKLMDATYHDMSDYMIAAKDVPAEFATDPPSYSPFRVIYNKTGGIIFPIIEFKRISLYEFQLPIKQCIAMLSQMTGFTTYTAAGNDYISYTSTKGEAMPVTQATSGCSSSAYDIGDADLYVDVYLEN